MQHDSLADNPTSSAKHQFDRQAAHYDAQWNEWNRESVAWMLEHAALQETDNVLDVATGTGYTALAFAPLANSVIGLDVSSGMLEVARHRAAEQGLDNATFEEGAAEELPYPDARFELVTCRIAAHHFVDVRRFASETARVLKPGGRLLLADTTVPHGDEQAALWQNQVERLRDPSHVRNYTELEWRAILEAADLRVVASTSAGGGIAVPLSDWLVKAGADEARAAQVRAAFDTAPETACRAFSIRLSPEGETFFTWQRVLIEACKDG